MWVHSKRAGDLCIDIIKGIVEYCRLAGDDPWLNAMIAYELLEDAYFAFELSDSEKGVEDRLHNLHLWLWENIEKLEKEKEER